MEQESQGTVRGAVIVGVVMALAVLAVPSQGFAFGLELGVGLKGGLSGSAVDRVPKQNVYQLEGGTDYAVTNTEFYPMFGLGGAFGLTLDARALGIVGLETGLHLSFDNGDGFEDKTLNGSPLARVDMAQRTTALHVPLLLKLASPGGMIKPVLGLGVEFVIQTDSSLTYTVEEQRGSYFTPLIDNNQNTIETSSYSILMLTLGIEIDLGPVRVPIELRAGYNVGFNENASARVRVEGDNMANARFFYDGAYQGHFGLFTGIVYDIDLLF